MDSQRTCLLLVCFIELSRSFYRIVQKKYSVFHSLDSTIDHLAKDRPMKVFADFSLAFHSFVPQTMAQHLHPCAQHRPGPGSSMIWFPVPRSTLVRYIVHIVGNSAHPIYFYNHNFCMSSLLVRSELNNCFIYQETKLSREIDCDFISCKVDTWRTDGIIARTRCKIIP